jgi:diguanylate cyclase (GGDEF)-like protein
MALRIMDTGPDRRFDNVARQAADMFGVPVALVTLLDEERQWFKAAVGTDMRQTPRSAAFCGYTLLEPGGLLVVEDAPNDPRFADNMLVGGEPHIRFYAGAVVRAPSGEPLGTLCIIDRVPRALDPAGRRTLTDLAEGVTALLALHGAETEIPAGATQDSLTGVADRALFDHRLALAVGQDGHGPGAALLLVDIDDFKRVNEQFGHLVGDALLRELAGRLTRLVRGTDLVARFGGDEFALLTTGPADPNGIAALAKRIKDALAAPLRLESVRVQVTASIGTACSPADGTTPEALLRAADRSLAEAKRPFAEAVRRAWGASGMGRRMEADLKTSLETDGLSMVWQPVFETASGRPYGYEALMRWNRPGVGPVPPSVFISVAESSGLIIELDSWAVRQACKAAARWPAHLTVAVNLTSHWFGDAGVAALIADAAAAHGLSPSRICVEITERTGIVSQHVARKQIEALHDLGVRVALDDFGTGYSSLAYLHELPIDYLKLDRAFVSVLDDGRRARIVARSVIELAHELRVAVCAEGIETPGQLAWLQASGCDYLQGYLLGRPDAELLPPDACLWPRRGRYAAASRTEIQASGAESV